MRAALLVLALGGLATPAFAGDDRVAPINDPLVLKECGACHMAFQPAFLPARSWNRMMDQLVDHFGEDAALSADRTKAIRDFYEANAGDVVTWGRARKYMRWVAPGGTPQKITENPDFLRKHERISERVWQDPKVVTKSNCPACHRGADQGWYDDG